MGLSGFMARAVEAAPFGCWREIDTRMAVCRGAERQAGGGYVGLAIMWPDRLILANPDQVFVPRM
jgi:hypothetical protein